jgi:hypothetical protein
MTDHPITPPPELVRQWSIEAENEHQPTVAYSMVSLLAAKAAQWGADQELEACTAWLRDRGSSYALALYTARRPKPPSLKDQAFEALDRMWTGGSTKSDWELFRRALEALPDD